MTAQPARNSTTWWRESDSRHHLHPFTDTKALAEKGGSRVITSAEGVYLTDSAGNRILDDMVEAAAPRWMEVRADFSVRGGIHTVVTAEFRAPDFEES